MNKTNGQRRRNKEAGRSGRKRKKRRAVALFLLCALLCSGCRIGDTQIYVETQQFTQNFAFSVNGMKAPLAEARLYLCNVKNLCGTIGSFAWEGKDDAQNDYLRDVSLDALFAVYCLDLMAEEADIGLSQKEEQTAAEAAARYEDSLTAKEHAYLGLTASKIEEAYRHYALARKYYEQITGGEEEELSDDAARVICLDILVLTQEEEAERSAARLREGETFSALLSQYGQTDGIGQYVSRGELPEEVEEVAFSLEEGEIAEAAAEDGTFFLLRCVSKYEERLTQENKEAILRQHKEEYFRTLYDDFLQKADVRRNDKIDRVLSLPKDPSCIETNSFFSLYEIQSESD